MRYCLLFLIALPCWALDTTGSAIDHAQALAKKKNRKEACAILRQEIASNPKSSTRAVESLEVVAKVFFTDKGQKAFEAGQASAFDNPDFALSQFRRALELEDDNLSVLLSLARLHIARRECAIALEFLVRARELHPLNGDAAVLELRGLQCLGRAELLREKSKVLPVLDPWQQSFVQFLTAKDLIEQGQAKKASDVLLKVSEENPQFPEVYYYLAKAGRELKKDIESWQQRYVVLCKRMNVRERRKFALEPMLCFASKEVEDELAKTDSEI